jgi:hypothetical protein
VVPPSSACPAPQRAWKGLDYTLAIADEIGVCDPVAWETLALAQGKRERSTLIGIGYAWDAAGQRAGAAP